MSQYAATVCGPVSKEKLGRTLVHEHVLFGYPGCQGDVTCAPRFDREAIIERSVEKLVRFRQTYGLGTIVDATPNDCGRNPELLMEISKQSGISILCSSGYYYEGEGATAYYRFRALLGDADKEIHEMMKTEVTEGIAGTDIKAGVFKVASSKNVITDYERRFFRAAAMVSAETGTPIITHTQEGTMGPEQADLLIENGADPNKIMIGHIDGNTDLRYHMKVLERGVFIGFDRFGLEGFTGSPSDAIRVACIVALVRSGYGSRIMLSHDSIYNWIGKPLDVTKPTHSETIFVNTVPALRDAGLTDDEIDTLLVQNPQRFLASGIGSQHGGTVFE
jgi:phosphotriesterase-related protein